MTERAIVIDLECTSREPAEAHIVEYAAVVVEPPWFGEESPITVFTGFVKPPIPIPAETSAVHHIIDEDVADAAPWELSSIVLRTLLAGGDPSFSVQEGIGRPIIAVAHNANYERELLKDIPMPNVRWICTYKAALRVWPDSPIHSNEGLRYWLKLTGPAGTVLLGRQTNQQPHSAEHDAIVTALLFGELLRVGTSIEDMLKWTEEPALLPTCPLGDWRGRKWEEVDTGFLMWITRKIQDRPDVVFCAQKELDRREREWEAERAAEAARRNTAAINPTGKLL